MHGPTSQTSSVAVSTGAEGVAIRDGDVSDAGRYMVQRRTNAETGCSMGSGAVSDWKQSRNRHSQSSKNRSDGRASRMGLDGTVQADGQIVCSRTEIEHECRSISGMSSTQELELGENRVYRLTCGYSYSEFKRLLQRFAQKTRIFAA